jgi:hypothetical protein
VRLKLLVGADVARDAVGEVRSLVDDDDFDRHNWPLFLTIHNILQTPHHYISRVDISNHFNRTEF